MSRRFSLISGNAYLLLMITMLFWGGNAVAGRFAVGDVSPLLLTWFRWNLGAAVLLWIARHHLRRDWPVIRHDLPYLFFMGAIGFAVFNALLYTALTFTTAINATIVQAGIPMFIFILNFLIFRTSVRPVQILGYSLTLIGVLLVASRGDVGQLADLDINLGDLIMILAGLVYASYSVALRAKPDIHWLSFVAVLFATAAVVSIPLAAYEATTATFIWPTTATAFGVIVYTAIFPSIIGQALFIRGIEALGGNAAGLFVNLVPIFGALLAILFLGEAFRAFHAMALMLVLGGITLAQRGGAGS